MTTVRVRLARLGVAALALAGLAACASGGGGTATPGTATPGPSPTAHTATRPSAIDGTAFYMVSSGDAIQVWSARNGTATKHHRIPVAKNDYCVGNSVVVSPDGKWLAWVTRYATDRSGIHGTLSVSGLDGRNPRTLENVICSFNELSWTADSQLAVTQVLNNVARPLYVDAQTGATQARLDTDVVSSANGAYRVRRETPGSEAFVVESATGAIVRTVKDYTNDYPNFDLCGYTLKGVSDDGRYVTIGSCATDPSRVLGAHYLFDTVKGSHVTLPVTRADAIVFLGGDTVLVRGPSATLSLVLMTTAGTVITEKPEPKAVATGTFLSYTPVAATP